ncbi:MAG: hypothetical protein GY847_09220 [Proteobacteria bacterium]|nr:hypothetical protein [Pseudomonadota bacterium]
MLAKLASFAMTTYNYNRPRIIKNMALPGGSYSSNTMLSPVPDSTAAAGIRIAGRINAFVDPILNEHEEVDHTNAIAKPINIFEKRFIFKRLQ